MAMGIELTWPSDDVLDGFEDPTPKQTITRAVQRLRAKGLEVETLDSCPWTSNGGGDACAVRTVRQRDWHLCVHDAEGTYLGTVIVTESTWRLELSGRRRWQHRGATSGSGCAFSYYVPGATRTEFLAFKARIGARNDD